MMRRLLVPAAAAVLCMGAAPLRPAPPPGSEREAPVRERLGDRELFRQAARVAWAYVEREYQPATGLINSVAGYPYATVWDLGSGLAALYSARELGLLDEAEYDRRMGRALRTLRDVPLFQGVALNKNYSTRSGQITGRDNTETTHGYGTSATDTGRLLVWLKIVARQHPRHAFAADYVVARLDLAGMVRDGYLWGASRTRSGRVWRYQEGRIPYEQYAAAGFALWGHPPERALRLEENALPVSVLDVPLVADRRGHDHLTSEPLVMLGLEVGWNPAMRELAANLLRVQEERHRRTGQLTVVSEDAIPRAPHYFFYYAVNYHGRQFAVVTQAPTRVLEGPRWVSAKAAFAWHALLPSGYTRAAVDALSIAGDPDRGWGSGIYEGSGRPTGNPNLNTAAVILEAALYHETGRPLLEGRGSEPGAPPFSPPTLKRPCCG